MLAIIIMSSLAIGLTTLFFFKNQNEDYHESRLQRKDSQIAKSIQYFLTKYDIENQLEDVPKSLYEKIEELSDVNDIGINIYDLSGKILFAFLPPELEEDYIDYEFENQVEDFVMNDLEKAEDNRVVMEKIGEDRMATYSYIRNQENKKIAILKIPYQDFSKKSIEFNSFYTALIEVYIFLLIGASIFAYYISNTISNSLKTIGDSMKSVGIDKKNERIVWKTKDEIGNLVNQYNNMIDQLEQSAELLAQSERETAWREMAKQVAHEIKNPLTPMKLNVQFLEQTLKPHTENFEERIKKFSSQMISQIDTLTNIADEFSSFAKMPKTSLVKVDLTEIISVTKETFDNEIKIAYTDFEDQERFINGDKKQLIRVFNNLFKNAVQAIPKEKKGVIIISLKQEGDNYIVEIKDNGKGIPKDQYQKIFVPNFTTKSSGSGLGLAMVKNIIKQHQGLIWFESKLEVGTTFFLSFPKYKD